MASFLTQSVLKLFLVISLFQISLAVRKLSEVVQDQPQLLTYHNGPLLSGKITINLIWYGKFKPSERAIVSDFVTSLSSTAPSQSNRPSVAQWWKTTEKYYHLTSKKSSLSLSLGKQILDDKYSLGKSLKNKQIVELASMGDQKNAINVVLTASDVAVEGFCMSRCGTHGSALGSTDGLVKAKKHSKFAYIWVGNSQTQCPGQCAWPFHQPIYGPQSAPLIAPNNNVGLDGMVINLASLFAGTVTNPFGNGYFQGPAEAPLEASSACPGIYGKGAYPGYAGNLLTQCPGQCAWPFHQPIYGPQSAPLIAPNNNVGLDGMVINLASLFAGTVTNPFGNGYFQGPAEAPLEASSACPGIYGKGAYPGYAGNLLVDPTTGASYNARGNNGRKYLLPALYDPSTSSCSTLV
ncbi:hypothetical protein GOBAR_AA17760 [Gossypium barbadense]|uniref:Protein EXORDIUM-like n=1 Tax=Gossypium barbadense TaxID=3634 RepID=A0A2P5XHZ2_GOSBA|nr:hypothetical protein GOBAR_AA17760 [Gossypium barbadense]